MSKGSDIYRKDILDSELYVKLVRTALESKAFQVIVPETLIFKKWRELDLYSDKGDIYCEEVGIVEVKSSTRYTYNSLERPDCPPRPALSAKLTVDKREAKGIHPAWYAVVSRETHNIIWVNYRKYKQHRGIGQMWDDEGHPFDVYNLEVCFWQETQAALKEMEHEYNLCRKS
ncbi:MAG: hypothetical protein JSW41_03370 [Candidatus Aenigmatarchaeota archaeon]|nr:MAG: hypothetical protein JSW41_03370 [Candidatus Aenigmarchaeota archaeon]